MESQIDYLMYTMTDVLERLTRFDCELIAALERVQTLEDQRLPPVISYLGKTSWDEFTQGNNEPGEEDIDPPPSSRKALWYDRIDDDEEKS